MWGVLEGDGTRLQCHECGGWFIAPGVHVGMRHSGVREYKLTHGLLMRASLSAPDLPARSAAAAPLALIAQHRDPDAARTLAPPEHIDRGR